MSKMVTFSNAEFGQIRIIEIDGEPWFVGKDVAAALGYSNTKDALARHVDNGDKLRDDRAVIRDSMGREQRPVIINEDGLYSLIFSSKLPNAKLFRKWIMSELSKLPRKSQENVMKMPKIASETAFQVFNKT